MRFSFASSNKYFPHNRNFRGKSQAILQVITYRWDQLLRSLRYFHSLSIEQDVDDNNILPPSTTKSLTIFVIWGKHFCLTRWFKVLGGENLLILRTFLLLNLSAVSHLMFSFFDLRDLEVTTQTSVAVIEAIHHHSTCGSVHVTRLFEASDVYLNL